MMAERLTFVLDGRDDLSRVLGHAGDSATRMRNTMTDAADGSGRAILTLTRDADGRLRDLQGQFVSTADAARLMATRVGGARAPMADWSAVADRSRKVGEQLRGMLISLAPAAIPAAAAMAPLIAQTAAAGAAATAAAAAYGLALGPQIKALGEASKAQQKYADAVEESGARSEAAVAAQAVYARQMAKLPPATRQAAAALLVLKDQYSDWSDALAKDTLTPVTKSFAVFGALLPKLTPMVRGTSVQLDRLVTLAGGAVSTPGFDRLMGRFNEFSTRTVRHATDGLVNFIERLNSGKVDGGAFREFMDYARAQGPIVGDTLRNIGQALGNLLRAGADVGVGMLQVVSALAKLVSVVPAGVITTLLQLAIAIKAVALASAGLAAGRAAMAAFSLQILAMRVAAVGATGPMAALTAAFGTLSRGAKLAVAGTGIGLLLIALTELSSRGRHAAPDVDKLTTSLGELGRTGKVTGEVSKAFGDDLEKLGEALRVLARPSLTQSIEQSVSAFLGYGEGGPEAKAAAEAFDALDKSLSNLVSSGKADLAAAALVRVKASLKDQGLTAKEVDAQLDDYKQAIASAAFEQQLAADSMGLFGQQAISTQQKLAAQKQSADGLRQAIQALNDVNRQGLGGMIGFEASIDAATKAAKENAGALRMVDGALDLNSEKSRTAAGALNDLAAKTDEAAGAARQSGASWSTVNGIYERGRQQLIANAMQMGLNRDQAKQLADQILKTPDKTARLRGNLEDLQAKLKTAKDKLAKVPDSRKSQIRATIADLEAKIRAAKAALNTLPLSRSVTVTTYSKFVNVGDRPDGSDVFARAHGGLIHRASGGLVGFPSGGMVRGPGTGTSDSILARVSAGEYVIRAAVVQKYGARVFDDINAMRLQTAPSIRAKALPAAPAPRAAVVTAQSGNGGGVFEGDLYLDSGEFLGAIRGVVRPMVRESEQRQAHRARVGRAT